MDLQQLTEFAGNHPLLVLALAAIVVMLVASELQHRLSRVKAVSPAEATRLLNHEDAVMIDMRSDKDYRAGHIVNAVHVPIGKDGVPASLDKYRERPLIVCCQHGQRSTAVCNKLDKQGFKAVYNLQGGLQAWQKADLPLTRNS